MSGTEVTTVSDYARNRRQPISLEAGIRCIANNYSVEQGGIEAMQAELRELRRKAALTDRLADEVLRHRARAIWDSSYSTTSETAEARARAGMVEEGLLL